MKRSKERLFPIASNRIPLQETTCPCLKMRSISCLLRKISVLVRLLLIRNCKAVSALSSAASEYKTATLCSHTCTETKLSVSLHLTWLVSSFSFITHEKLQISSHVQCVILTVNRQKRPICNSIRDVENSQYTCILFILYCGNFSFNLASICLSCILSTLV